jgi:hypothetical protein
MKDALNRELDLDAQEDALAIKLQEDNSVEAHRLLSDAGHARIMAMGKVDDLLESMGFWLYGSDSQKIKRILLGLS